MRRACEEWFEAGKFSVSRGQAIVSEWTEDLVAALSQSGAAMLRIERWREATLERLLPFSGQLTTLYLECEIDNLSALSGLANLRTVSLRAGAETVDWSRMKRLREVAIWSRVPAFGNLGRCRSLRSLRLTDCGLRDLSPLAGFGGLEELLVFEAPLRSLDGAAEVRSLRRLVLQQVPLKSLNRLEQCRALRELSVYMATQLGSVATLTRVPALRTLTLGASRKIRDLARIGDLPNLERLDLASIVLPSPDFVSRLRRLTFLRLDGVGKLRSLEFLRPLTALEVCDLGESTTVVSGDLGILMELPELREVRYRDRRHYSHEHAVVMNILIGRRVWGPGSFQNETAVRWSAGLPAVSDGQQRLEFLGGYLQAVLGGPAAVPAMAGQQAVAAAEVVARLHGRRRERSPHSAKADRWVRETALDPGGVLVEKAVEALDLVIGPASNLARAWAERGESAAWLASVNELRGRLLR